MGMLNKTTSWLNNFFSTIDANNIFSKIKLGENGIRLINYEGNELGHIKLTTTKALELKANQHKVNIGAYADILIGDATIQTDGIKLSSGIVIKDNSGMSASITPHTLYIKKVSGGTLRSIDIGASAITFRQDGYSPIDLYTTYNPNNNEIHPVLVLDYKRGTSNEATHSRITIDPNNGISMDKDVCITVGNGGYFSKDLLKTERAEIKEIVNVANDEEFNISSNSGRIKIGGNDWNHFKVNDEDKRINFVSPELRWVQKIDTGGGDYVDKEILFSDIVKWFDTDTSNICRINNMQSNVNICNSDSIINTELHFGSTLTLDTCYSLILASANNNSSIFSDSNNCIILGKIDSESTLQVSAESSVIIGYAENSSSISAEGMASKAIGYADSGSNIKAFHHGSVAEGYAYQYSDILAKNNGTLARGSAEGGGIISAEGNGSHAEGYSDGNIIQAKGNGSFAYGHAYHANIFAEGDGSVVHGYASNTDLYALGHGSHAEGDGTKAYGYCSHSEGGSTEALGQYTKSSGDHTIATGYASVAIGSYNEQYDDNKFAFDSSNTAFVIGNGDRITRSNAFRVNFDGEVYAYGEFNSGGADYAEYFEWEDGNPNDDDRIGLFVSLTESGKIKVAEPNEDIIGVISGISSVVGNAAEDTWDKMYLRDIYGRLQHETVTVERPTQKFEIEKNEDGTNKVTYRKKRIKKEDGTFELVDDLENPIPVYKLDENGKRIPITETVEENRLKLNPDYDPNQKYVPRSKRCEWDVVGLLGQLIVIDDGTCQVGKKCSVSNNGIATLGTDYRVIKRLDDTHIMILSSFL